MVTLVEIDPADLAGQYHSLVAHYSYRWLLRDREVSIIPWRMPKKRQDQGDRHELVRHAQVAFAKLDEAYDLYHHAGFNDPLAASLSARALRQDYWELEHKTLGRAFVQPLPKSLFPQIPQAPQLRENGVTPATLARDAENVVLVTGTNLATAKTAAVGGIKAEILQALDHSVVLKVPAGRMAEQAGIAAVFVATAAGSAMTTVALGGPVDDGLRSLTITRDENGRPTGIQFTEQGSLKGDKLIEAISRILAPPDATPSLRIEQP